MKKRLSSTNAFRNVDVDFIQALKSNSSMNRSIDKDKFEVVHSGPGGLGQLTEEKKMAESQSRYGIMEQMNQKRISEREKLAEMKLNFERKKFDREAHITLREKELSNTEVNYERDHFLWKKQKQLEISLLTNETNNKIAEIETEIQESAETYEQNFQDYKTAQTATIVDKGSELVRWLKSQDLKIKAKKDTIIGIEQSINDLKELSKEQAK